jgi:hypothetical protein
MTEKTDVDSLGAALLDRNDGLQEYRGVSRSNGVAFYVPPIGDGGSAQASGARGQVRQGGVRPQERATDYRVVAAWGALMVLIGAAFWVFGMALVSARLAASMHPIGAAILDHRLGAKAHRSR